MTLEKGITVVANQIRSFSNFEFTCATFTLSGGIEVGFLIASSHDTKNANTTKIRQIKNNFLISFPFFISNLETKNIPKATFN